MASEQHLRRVSPCSRYLTGGDTNVLCAVCLGVQHDQSALEGAGCKHRGFVPTKRERCSHFFIFFYLLNSVYHLLHFLNT